MSFSNQNRRNKNLTPAQLTQQTASGTRKLPWFARALVFGAAFWARRYIGLFNALALLRSIDRFPPSKRGKLAAGDLLFHGVGSLLMARRSFGLRFLGRRMIRRRRYEQPYSPDQSYTEAA